MKLWMYIIGVVTSIGLATLFLPIRWKVDLSSSVVSLGRASYYENLRSSTNGGYVLVREKSDPRKIAKVLDEKKAYLGALEFSDGYESSLRAEVLRKEKKLFFRAFDPDPKMRYSPSEIYAKMRRAVLERSVDLILTDHVPENIVEKFRRSFKTSERPFPNPGIPWKKWMFSVPIFIILGSLSPAISVTMLILAIFQYDLSISISSILATVAIYKWTKKNPFYLFLAFLLLGIITNASLSDFLHMNGVLDFRGVKLSLAFLPLLVLSRGLVENGWFFKKKKYVISSAVFLVLVVYYIYRSGNYGHALPYEIQIRDFLDRVLWIRPRFKEVFGYSFIFFAFGRSRWSFLYEFFGSIALASTFNTFCHIKAPIYTSIYRSLLAFGISYGIYLIIKGGIRVAENKPGANEVNPRGSERKQKEDGKDSGKSRGKEG